jgi:hypothetical protein
MQFETTRFRLANSVWTSPIERLRRQRRVGHNRLLMM